MSYKLTILNVLPDERPGGPGQRVLQVSALLQQRGIHTIVAMPDGDKNYADRLKVAGIPFYQLKNFKRLPPGFNLLTIIKWLLYFCPGTISLVRLIRKKKVNIVHANGFMSLQAPLAAKLSGRKLVWHLNDTMTPAFIKILLFPFLHLCPDTIAIAAKAVGQYYLGNNLKNKTVTLYPPVDTAKFYPDNNSGEALRAEFKFQAGDKIVGIVGNINPAKGYEHFVRAVKLIKDMLPGTKFLIVGQALKTRSKYTRLINELISDLHLVTDITFTGYRVDVGNLINIMDVFVSTSITEASPIVILEAMACAKPVVATSVGGVPELLINRETGILVPPKDPQAVAEAVLYLLSHPEEASELGIRGRKSAINTFDLTICTSKHEQMYLRML